MENAFFDEKEDAWAVLGKNSVNTCVAVLPDMEVSLKKYQSSGVPSPEWVPGSA